MKTISVRDLQKNIKEIVDAAQRDRIVVTRRGEPAAVLLGVNETADIDEVDPVERRAVYRVFGVMRGLATDS